METFGYRLTLVHLEKAVKRIYTNTHVDRLSVFRQYILASEGWREAWRPSPKV